MKHRFNEPSTYAGLAAVAVGVGQVFGVHVPSGAAETAIAAAGAGDWALSIGAIGAGLAAIFGKDRGAPDKPGSLP